MSPFVCSILIIFIYFQGRAPIPCHCVWRSKVSLWESVFSLNHAFSRYLTLDWPQAPFPVEPSWAPHSHSALPQVQAYLDWAHQCTLVSLTIDREVGPSPLGLLSGWTHACEHNMDGWEPSTGRYESKRRNVYAMHEWWRGSCWQTLTLFWHGPSALLRVMLSYSSLCHFPKP